MRLSTLVSIPLLAVAVGCGGPAPVAARKAPLHGKPAHFRIVNLSGETVSAQVGKTYPVPQLAPGEMTGAMPVSPNRKFKVTVSFGKKDLSLEETTQPGKFVTVVVTPDHISDFISGRSLGRPEAPIVDYVNLTDKPLEFKSGVQSTTVGPMTSESIDASNGTATFSVGSAAPITANMGRAQIWAIYAFKEGGKLQLKSASVKGDGSAAGTGGTAL